MAKRPLEHQPMRSCLIRCIHAAYQRVTPKRIADWFLDLPPFIEPDVLAFFFAEAPSDPLIRAAGDLIATHRLGGPASMNVQAGRRGRREHLTRNAYMFAALAALKEQHGGAIRYEYKNNEGRAKDDWCAVVAREFHVKPQRLRSIWDQQPKPDRERIRRCYKRWRRIGAYLQVGRRALATHRPGRVTRGPLV